MEKDMALSLRSEFFGNAVEQFDKGLRDAILDAEDKKLDTVKFTLSGELNLVKADVRDRDVLAYEAVREIVKPVVKYKTDFTLQLKTSDSGRLRDDCELVWDSEHHRYIVRTEEDGQTSLFDDEDDSGGITYHVDSCGGVTMDAGYEEIDGAPLLPEPPRQLPPPREGGLDFGFGN